MDGAQDPRAYTVGVGLGFRSRPAGSEGCPLGAWEAEGEVEKWVVMVGLPLAYHSTMMPNFYGVLGFFHIFFFFFFGCGATYSCPFKLCFHSQQLAPP